MILSVLILFLLFLVIKTIVENILKFRLKPNLPLSQTRIDNEIKALINEIKNLKNSFIKNIPHP
jgi:hypothetical protein